MASVISGSVGTNSFMTEQAQAGAGPLDTVKLVVAVGLVVAGVAGFYLLADQPIWLRWIGVLAGLVLGGLVALQSAQGRDFSQFVQTARIELRKVVWPNRQETLQTTVVVFFMVILLAVFFWVLDTALGSLTRWLTGQGG
jgi:preprotein translocase subunit SecE